MKLKRFCIVLLIMFLILIIYDLSTNLVYAYYPIQCPYCGAAVKFNNSKMYREYVYEKPTCVSTGTYYKYYTCQNKRCSKSFPVYYNGNKRDDSNHILSITKYVEPTCTEDGYKVQVCKYHPLYNKLPYKKKLGHDYSVYIGSEDPTCQIPKKKNYKCSRCNSTSFEFVPGTTIPHQPDKKTGICWMCNRKVVTKKKDTPNNLDTPDNSDTPDGEYYPTNPQKFYEPNITPVEPSSIKYEEIHVHTWINATCESPKRCTSCGETVGGPLGHSFNTFGVCVNCGLYDEEKQTQWVLETNGGSVGAILENGILTITGDGKVIDYAKSGNNKCPWTKIGRDRIQEVVIKGKLQTIPTYFFYYCSNIKKITIEEPDSITRIGEGAFFGCWQLSTIELKNQGINILPKNVKAIGARAFCHCHELYGIDLTTAEGLERIGHEAFRDCWNLWTVLLPEGLKVIGYEAFFNCISLHDVILPSTLRCIGRIGDAEDLKYARDLDNEPAIGKSGQVSAEYKVANNTSGFNNVFRIDLSSNIRAEKLSENSKRQITNEIKGYMKAILVQNGVIGKNDEIGFTMDETSWSVTDLNAEQKIKYNNFINQTRVWYYADNSDSESLMEKYLKQTQDSRYVNLVTSELKWDLSKDSTQDKVEGFLDVNGTFTVRIKDGTQDAKGETLDFNQAKTPWNKIRSKIQKINVEEGVTSLGNFLFYYSSASEVNLPSTLKKIGSGTFMGCTKITSITLPENVEELGQRAFCHAEGLKEIILPKNITTLNGETFRDCYSLTTVSADGEITYMQDKEFYNDPNLRSIFPISTELFSVGSEIFKVDFDDEIYESISTWKSSYNNGNYPKLNIYYYEDCPIIAKIIANEKVNGRRVFNVINIKDDGITLKDEYKKVYKDSQLSNIEDNIPLQVSYDNGKIRTINLNLYNIKVRFDDNYRFGIDDTLLCHIDYCDKTIDFTVNVEHDWDSENGKCLGCNKVCNHRNDDNEECQAITTTATCLNPGEETRTCLICGYSEKKNVAALGHYFENGVCTRCGETSSNNKEQQQDVEPNLYVTSKIYKIAQNKVSKVQANTSIKAFKDNIAVTAGASKEIFDKNNKKIDDDNSRIKTGMKLVVSLRENVKAEYPIIVLGDVNGDGILDAIDLYKFANYLFGTPKNKTNLTGLYLEATDFDQNGVVANLTDLYHMAKAILNGKNNNLKL